MEKIRTYSEMIALPTFKERYEYLKLDGVVGASTFGYDRYLNQEFYQSQIWKDVRKSIIFRDDGCDLGCSEFPISGRAIIHHINPLCIEDILYHRDCAIDPEYLICVTKKTHDAIHFGDDKLLYSEPTIRTKNDTCPWRK